MTKMTQVETAPAAALHNLGVAIHPAAAPSSGLILAAVKGCELLNGLYPVQERTTVVAEGNAPMLSAGSLLLEDRWDRWQQPAHASEVEP